MKLPDVQKIYLASTPVREIYLGDELVWPAGTGCTPEGGVMSVSGLVDGGVYVLYGCGYVGAKSDGVLMNANPCEAQILNEYIELTGGTPTLFVARLNSGGTFQLETYLNGVKNYLIATDTYAFGYRAISVNVLPVGSTATLFNIVDGKIEPNDYAGDIIYISKVNDIYRLRAQTEDWVLSNVSRGDLVGWTKLYRVDATAPTGITIVNSIYPQDTYVQNRINLPFQTALGMEFFFEGEILANVGGICFGGIHTADSNDFRFFCSTVAYYDCGSRRISITGANRGNIRKVHTYNYGFELTFADGTVRSNTGTTLTAAPELDATIEVGRMKIKSFKATLGNTVVFDGYPARRDSDGYLGLYDMITGQFCLPENQNYLTYD